MFLSRIGMIGGMEVWKPIPGFPHYEASTLGRIHSLRRRVQKCTGVWAIVPGGMLRPTLQEHGYLNVNLYRDQKPHPFLVQYVILRTFVSERPPGLDALHRDDVKTNNDLTNLYWGTDKQNREDARRNGRMGLGDTHPGAKLNSAKVTEARRLRSAGWVWSALATHFGVSIITIRYAVIKRTWRHVP